jgi:hypothetical protein
MCPYVFPELEHLGICPGEVLLDLPVVLCPIFLGTAKLIPRVVGPACNPAIPLLGIYPKDVPNCNKDTFSTMFITA